MKSGLGFKPEHFEPALAARQDGLWFEVHAENYMVDGGPRLRALEALRAQHPISLHGVSMSLAGERGPDAAHLQRFGALVRRIRPALVSEHLAWSDAGGRHLPDLLPFARTHEALRRIVRHIDRAQSVLGTTLAIENPSHYLRIEGHDWSEIDFLAELVRRTGCRLLLDINNVQVSATNLGFDAARWLDAFPAAHVAEIHLAGHSTDPQLGDALLVDSHDTPVAASVWDLYRRFVAQAGPRPTLIERDGDVPAFDVLMAECGRAASILEAASPVDALA